MAKLAHKFYPPLLSILTAVAACLSVGVSAAEVPNPPSQICVNGKCTASAAASSGSIKWHPGYYGATANYTRPGNSTAANKLSEINMVRGGPAAVLGILESYYWRVFENSTAGSYDFSVLDTDYKNITGYVSGSGPAAKYNAPRRLIINTYLSDYFNADPTQAAVPDYIVNSSSYGPVGPDGVHSGYTVSSGLGSGACGSVSACGAVAAIYRSSVMNRAIALMQALAAHTLPDGYTVDTSPYVEAVIPILETATTVPVGVNDSTWSDANTIAQLGLLQSAMNAAFAHTNIAIPSNWMGTNANAGVVVQNLLPSRSGESGPDVFGYSSGQGSGSGLTALTPGQLGYIGGMGGRDLRTVLPEIANVQNTELIGEYGQYYQPCDILQQGNQTLHATHMTWQIVTGMPGSGMASQDVTANWYGNAGSQSAWSSGGDTVGGVLTTIVNNKYCNGGAAVSVAACPTSYTSGCNTSQVLPLLVLFRRRRRAARTA